jgi:protein-S-isoprenylcysteine O-methyltransferase Ste14
MPPALLFAIAWIGWIVTWAAAAFWSGRTEKRVNTWEVWVYRAASLAGLVLLNHRTAHALGVPKLWHVGLDGAYTLAALTFGGILFAWWARIHLGRLWSGSITVKEGHRVVDTGPYGLVRHPIYTGLIFATIATAVAQATVTGLAAIALISIGLWLKARVEERFLAAELGPDDYAAYRSRVPMLVPFMPAGV